MKLLSRCLKKEKKYFSDGEFDPAECLKNVTDAFENANNLQPSKKSKEEDAEFFKNFQMTLESTLSCTPFLLYQFLFLLLLFSNKII